MKPKNSTSSSPDPLPPLLQALTREFERQASDKRDRTCTVVGDGEVELTGVWDVEGLARAVAQIAPPLSA